MASLDLTDFLDKAHEQTPLSKLLDLPVSAIQGVSEADGEALKKAFGIKTIGDLGRNKYFVLAQSMAQLVQFAGK
ncbi:hypothetical protein LPC08_09705 [Roseomonas sp. OT10]|uniref:hypothetical protein n=1 Tax=Roseomonas cutis TaxID=2897332 RepID=UPI001E307F82|nr:hypothetical protein [Roseomonas sp. OT10]UFN50855.1 hypothetical protein LPC08_09705 [Roseomonas sp. OT10]